MKMNWIIRSLLILLTLNFLFFEIFAEDEKMIIMGQYVPKVKFKHIDGVLAGIDVVDRDTLTYFKDNRQETVRYKIKDNLKKYYIAAWKAYITNKSILPSCVTMALDNLHNKVPEVYLNFVFSSASAYFDERQLMGQLSGEKTVWKDDNMIDYGGDIGGGGLHSGDKTIFLIESFSSPSKFIEFNTIIKGCEFKTHIDDFDFEIEDYVFLKLWDKKSGYVGNSIPGIIFHELVHMALAHSTTASSRAEDEATVEDIQLKIFPGAVPIYEGTYFESLWKYKIESEINKRLPFKFKFYESFEYFSVPNGDHWKRRTFNPPFKPSNPNELLYKKVEKKIDTILSGRAIFGSNDIVKLLSNEDGSNTDDAKCEPMKKYCIPYRICCENECDPQPPEEPGNDNADDNYSYFTGIVQTYNLAPEAVIFTKGYWENALKLFGGLTFDGNNSAAKLLETTPFLVIPSGALASLENDTAFRYFLELYVGMGGNIIVFAQQYGADVEKVVPVPQGEPLKVYGWRQDQSCLKNSIYFNDSHPVLSSATNQLVDAGVDGYFASYPSNTLILLQRRTNSEPALIAYPYGSGHVILTSMFTDWGYAHSQATSAEIKIIRDLITFAKNPNLPIPMYNLEENANPDITLDVVVKNTTDSPAGKVKVIVSDANREIILYESEEACISNCIA